MWKIYISVVLCTNIQIVPPPQKKNMITGLLASITFKVMNQSRYALGFWNYNKLSAFCWKPRLIWFSSHKGIRFFVRYVSPFHPNFHSQQTHTAQWTRNSTLHTPVEWQKKKCDYWTKSDGVFGKMQIIRVPKS